MELGIEVAANLFGIRGDDFYVCSSPFQSFQPFDRYAPFKPFLANHIRRAVSSFGFRVSGFGFRVSGFEFFSRNAK
jgi:hypothetical protein